ncbi:MAG: RNA-splicing ligase RtcB [Chlamydiae bacterium]|nr:RNA-splicing ligase RtcB [Chlamydiota bacterium]
MFSPLLSKLKKIAPATYLLPKEGGMRVPGLVIASEKLLEEIEIEKPLLQVRNVAYLPGIVGYSIAMPDIHWGYGFPIGGVAATSKEGGVISPGGVGYDINCGVRLALAPIRLRDLNEATQEALLKAIYQKVPSGVGHGHRGSGVSEADYKKLLEEGAKWSVEQGYGFPSDLEHIESHGTIPGADYAAVSQMAKDRGKKQLGSIGSGNHFVELGEIQKNLLPETAEAWGMEEGQLYILIHSGSRGFGHQVCQDTLNSLVTKGFAEGLPDRQLVAAPLESPEGKEYFAAMNAAANYAFNNRQQILHWVREAFQEVLQISPEKITPLYDVCHNIAKFEEYEVEGKKQLLCVHRKGATRAFGPGHPELSPLFQQTGQPVLVPGDMGRASYVLAGLGNPLTWCSSCHGAGRAKSRIQSMRRWKGAHPFEYMKSQGVRVMASSYKTVAEEMPDAYKEVDAVVEAVEEAGLATRVARLRPHLVLKG